MPLLGTPSLRKFKAVIDYNSNEISLESRGVRHFFPIEFQDGIPVFQLPDKFSSVTGLAQTNSSPSSSDSDRYKVFGPLKPPSGAAKKVKEEYSKFQ